jgi:hypothetical protein
VAGVHIVLVDEWGNRADAWSKGGESDYGRYDFPIHTVVDAAGNPISGPPDYSRATTVSYSP